MKAFSFLLAIAVIEAAIVPNDTGDIPELKHLSLRAAAPKLWKLVSIELYTINFLRTGSTFKYLGFEDPNVTPITKLQSKGVDAEITKGLVTAGVGSSTYGVPHFPPGFIRLRQLGKCPHRGHLLAKELGGSGVHVQNIVTLTEQVNINLMRPYEDEVASLWSSGRISEKCRVRYKVRARYQAGRLHPKSISIDAKVYNPFDNTERPVFNVTIQNEPVPPRPAEVRHNLDFVRCTPTPTPAPGLGPSGNLPPPGIVINISP